MGASAVNLNIFRNLQDTNFVEKLAICSMKLKMIMDN